MNTRFAAASLRIKYIPVDGTMMIDTDTARNLELVGNKIHQKSSHSLFGLIFFVWAYVQMLILLFFIEYWITRIQQWHLVFCGWIFYHLLRVGFPLPPNSPLTNPVVHSSIDARLDVVEGILKTLLQLLVAKIDTTELINEEDRFTYVRDALKTLNKMDFDKLIVSVPKFYTHLIACLQHVLACLIWSSNYS